jgi:hypothetical protein
VFLNVRLQPLSLAGSLAAARFDDSQVLISTSLALRSRFNVALFGAFEFDLIVEHSFQVVYRECLGIIVVLGGRSFLASVL